MARRCLAVRDLAVTRPPTDRLTARDAQYGNTALDYAKEGGQMDILEPLTRALVRAA
jgi:hypothetical protein